MNSRGAATECSPGREPGVFFRHDLSPGGAKESFGVFRSFGAAFPNDTYPGLAPGATLCRRSAAEYSTGFSPSSLRKFPRPQSQLGQIAVARRECALPTQYLLSELLTHHTSSGACSFSQRSMAGSVDPLAPPPAFWTTPVLCIIRRREGFPTRRSMNACIKAVEFAFSVKLFAPLSQELGGPA